MVTQAKAAKVSSEVRNLLKRIAQASTVKEKLEVIFPETEPGGRRVAKARVLRAANDVLLCEWRKTLLLELANLQDSGFARFQRIFQQSFGKWSRQIEEWLVLRLRDELRKVWDSSTPIQKKQQIVDEWTKWNPRPRPSQIGDSIYRDYRMWVPVLATGRLTPGLDSLHGQLVQGVMEQFERLRICGNPECPTPYFLARRKDQKYCERGDCTSYAQRQYALKWWHSVGGDRRRKESSKVSRKQRKRSIKR